jgi:type IV pilus assembly protein PilA
MKQAQSGFTLIELMIVIAIVGILATFAIPAYQDYVARSQAGEGYALSDGYKTAVGDIYMDEGDFADADSGSFGIPVATTIKGNYVSNVSITDGTIVALLGVNASAAIAGETIALEPTNNGGSISWTCRFSGDAKYAPKACR